MRRRQVVDEPVPGLTTIEVMHAGDASVIYRARREGSDTPVVVKLLRSRTNGGRRDEVELWRTLSTHQGILSILDTGQTPTGLPYLVLEDCASGSLADMVRANGPLPVGEVVRIGVAVAHGLRAVHAHDMLHHAVSPENIVSARFGPALIDFGATLPSWDPFPPTGHGRSSIVHAPPEEARGVRPAPASDIYRLASTLWTLLAGFPPFDDGPDPLPAGRYRERLLTRPARRVPREDVPDWLQETLRHALAKDPELRPATADDLIALLRREREPTPPDEPPRAEVPPVPAMAGAAVPARPEADPGTDPDEHPEPEEPPEPEELPGPGLTTERVASAEASAESPAPSVGGVTASTSSDARSATRPATPPASASAVAATPAAPAVPAPEKTPAPEGEAAPVDSAPPSRIPRRPPSSGPGWTGPGWNEPRERPRSRALHLALLVGGTAVVLLGVGAIGLFAVEIVSGGASTTTAEDPDAVEDTFELPDDLPAEPRPGDTPEGAVTPAGVELRDGTIAAALSWIDNSDGAAVHYVVGGPVDAETSTMADAPPGATEVEVTGLNPDVEYCFRVVAVLSSDVLAPSEEVCTDRAAD